MTNLSPLLIIRDLHVVFSSAQGPLKVVHGLNLELNRGEILGIVGQSGSGKSVTAQAVVQLLGNTGQITQGEIWFDGECISSKSQSQMLSIRGKKIGMVFQDPMTALNPTLSIGWQLSETLVYHERLSHRQARHRAMEILDSVGIAEPEMRYDAYPFQLSGGMRQRIMIAIAIACKPKLIIADEPTTALDVTIQAQILELLQKSCREADMSLLLITHDLGIVASICDRAAVMHNGTIIETNLVESLFASPIQPYTRSLLAAQRNDYE